MNIEGGRRTQVEKSEKSTVVCSVTKAADIKFHRQTRNPRVLEASEFRLLFASNGERGERAIGPLPLAAYA